MTYVQSDPAIVREALYYPNTRGYHLPALAALTRLETRIEELEGTLREIADLDEKWHHTTRGDIARAALGTDEGIPGSGQVGC